MQRCKYVHIDPKDHELLLEYKQFFPTKSLKAMLSEAIQAYCNVEGMGRRLEAEAKELERRKLILAGKLRTP